jgi:hypothetical protein
MANNLGAGRPDADLPSVCFGNGDIRGRGRKHLACVPTPTLPYRIQPPKTPPRLSTERQTHCYLGLCQMHYQRRRKSMDMTAPIRIRRRNADLPTVAPASRNSGQCWPAV